MLTRILIYLFSKSSSRMDTLLLMTSVILMINKKWVEGLLLLLIGGVICAIIEVFLGI